MIVLGIDPGSRVTGYGFIEVLNPGERLIECDIISVTSLSSHQLRLKSIYDQLCERIKTHLPDLCAVEMPVYGKNPQSMLKLGRIQAAAMLAALSMEVPVVEYTPKEVKKAVTGNGNASKVQVAYMVRNLLSIDDAVKLRHDATDALAVGLCHARRSQTPKQSSGGSWEKFIRENPDRVR